VRGREVRAPVAGPSAWQVARLRARLVVVRHRRAVVAGLLALAVIAGLRAVRPVDPASPSTAGAAPGRSAGGRGAGGPAAIPGAGRAGGLLGLTAVTVRLADPASALVAARGARVDVVAGPPLDPLAPGAGQPGGSQPGGGQPGAGRSDAGQAAVVIARGALVLAAPVDGARASPSPAAGLGLPGFPGSGAPASPDGAAARAGPPSGVVVVAVTPSDALRLAGVAGVRALSLTRGNLSEGDFPG